MNKRQSNNLGKFGHAFTTHTTPRSGSLSLCSRHIYSTPCVVIRVPRVYEKRRSGQAGRLEEKAVSRTRRRNLGPDDQLTVVLFQMEILIVPLFSDVPLQLFRQQPPLPPRCFLLSFHRLLSRPLSIFPFLLCIPAAVYDKG